MMKIYDCGDCYITTRLADWQLLAMLRDEGWEIEEVKEVSDEEYRRGIGEDEVAHPLISSDAPIREKGRWAIPDSLCRTCLNLTSPHCDTINKKWLPNKNGVKCCEGYERMNDEKCI